MRTALAGIGLLLRLAAASAPTAEAAPSSAACASSTFRWGAVSVKWLLAGASVRAYDVRAGETQTVDEVVPVREIRSSASPRNAARGLAALEAKTELALAEPGAVYEVSAEDRDRAQSMSFDGPVKATLVRFESARVVEAGFVDGCGRRGTVSTYATNARMSGMLECGGKDKAEASEREAEELLCGQPAAD